jgi:hypothetical protein
MGEEHERGNLYNVLDNLRVQIDESADRREAIAAFLERCDSCLAASPRHLEAGIAVFIQVAHLISDTPDETKLFAKWLKTSMLIAAVLWRASVMMVLRSAPVAATAVM